MSVEAKKYYDEGINHTRSGRFVKAIACFDKAISLDKKSSLPWHMKGNALYGLKRYKESLEAFDQSISLDKENTLAWESKGLAMLKSGLFEESIKAYDEAIALDKTNAHSWKGKGDALKSLGRNEEAIFAYGKAISLKPKSVHVLCETGKMLHELGGYEEAIMAYNAAIDVEPDKALHWLDKGKALNMLDRFEEAIKCLDKTDSLKPDLHDTWNEKGIAFSGLKRFEDALFAFDKAIEHAPRNQTYWSNKGSILIKLKRYNEAITAVDMAIELSPKYAMPWFKKGQAFFRLGKYEDASSAFDQAISLDPKMPDPWFLKNELHDVLGEVQQARGCFMRAYHLSGSRLLHLPISLKSTIDILGKYSSDLFIYRISRDHPILMSSHDWALTALGALERCVGILQFIRFVKRSKGFHNEIERKKFLGITYLYLGDPLEAHKIFDEVDSLDDDDLMGQYYLVASMNAYEEPADNELDFALKKAQQILGSRDDVGPEQLFYAGLLLYLNKQFESAIVAFRSVLDKDGNNLAAQYMLMLSFHRQKRVGERNKLIQVVLKKERLLHAEGRQGFIGGVFPKSFDLVSTKWDRPFRKYARWVEISEAIMLINELVERHELRHGELPKKIRFLDEAKDEPEGSLQGWVQNEKFVAEIERAKADMDRDDIEVMSCELKKSFHPFFFVEQPETITDFEFEIGQLIKKEKKPAKKDTQRYHDLIAYCYFQDKISGRSYALLTYYLFYNLFRYEQKKRKRYVEEAFKATLFESLSFLVTYVTGQSLPKPVSPAVYAGFSYSYDKIKELVLDSGGAGTMSYAEFKTHLNNFFVELAEKRRYLPESVKSLWMPTE